MMNSYRQNNTSARRLLAVTSLVIFLFVADVLSGGKIRFELRTLVGVVTPWLTKVSTTIAGSGVFSSRAVLEAQNRSLTDELAQFEERAGGYDVLKAENEQLRALTHLAADTIGVTAPITSSVRSSPYGTFLIGAGSADGIARGSLVLTPGGFVVGVVADVGAHTAIIAEVFAPNASIEGIVDGAAASIAGSGGGNARTALPRGLVITPGDPVFSPVVGQRAIGIVGAVASSSASASQDVFIRLPVNLASLQFVYVVSSGK